MSIVKQAALEALAAHLRTVLGPELPDIYVNNQDPDKEACWPHLIVRAQGDFAFQPFDADELGTTGSTVTVHVGDFSGRVQLQLGAKSSAQRVALGDRILTEFLKTAGKPGVLVLQLTGFEVGGVEFTNDLPVGFMLDADAWSDELVFERKRYENLDLAVDIPALVTWTETYDINHLVMAFTGDLTSEPEDLATDDPTYEEVAVTDTGALEEYP